MRLWHAALTTMVLILTARMLPNAWAYPALSTAIRLPLVDAPETDQVCLNAGGQQWTCGIEARDRLAARIAGREIKCVSADIDGYGRDLALCSAAGEDLNGWMVQEGWALAYVKYSSAYVMAEEQARTRQSGLWQGAFIAPWDWRHRNNKTIILGAFNVPINAQSVLLPRSATEGAPSAECIIKGNVNASGERIYHMPGQEFYAKVRMDVGKGNRWFCTKEEAGSRRLAKSTQVTTRWSRALRRAGRPTRAPLQFD